MIDFNDMTDYELESLAKAALHSRIALRSAGIVSNDDRHALSMELHGLYELDREQLIQSIKKHCEIYKKEQGNNS